MYRVRIADYGPICYDTCFFFPYGQYRKPVVLFIRRNHLVFLFQRLSFGLRRYLGHPSFGGISS